jgi:hypothetical protein
MSVEGVVTGVDFTPGRTDGLVELALDGKATVRLIAADPESALTWDGGAISYPDLMAKLAVSPARVTASPRGDRYGAALKADFTPEGQ